jgi:hypothetical protein
MSERIVGIHDDYGSLIDLPKERIAFLGDAERCLTAIGKQLQDDKAISEYQVLQRTAGTPNYAGSVWGTYFAPDRRIAVSVVFSHNQDEVNTRPDGVAAYGLYRRFVKHKVESARLNFSVKQEDRIPLKWWYPNGIKAQVLEMLKNHPLAKEAA